jgi:hypothetical protein
VGEKWFWWAEAASTLDVLTFLGRREEEKESL